jgi:hypothetical protein
LFSRVHIDCRPKVQTCRSGRAAPARLDDEGLAIEDEQIVRKRAREGTAIVHVSKPQPDGTQVKALGRAWRWQRMLDDGV